MISDVLFAVKLCVYERLFVCNFLHIRKSTTSRFLLPGVCKYQPGTPPIDHFAYNLSSMGFWVGCAVLQCNLSTYLSSFANQSPS